MASMQNYTFIGNVGRDPEMRYTGSGQAVTAFSVAVTEQYKNPAGENVKKTIWIRVSAWGKLAETVNQYVKKGMMVYVSGKLTADDSGGPKVYTKQDGTAASSFEVNAQQVLFLSRVEGQPAPVADEENPF